MLEPLRMSESSSSSVDDADAHEAGSDWLVLPKEVAAEVFRHLDVVDRTNLRLTCRGVRRLVDSATWALSPKLLKMREVAELFPSLQHLDVSAQVTDRRSRDGERWTAPENSGDVAGLDAVGQLTALTYLSFRSNPSMSFMGLGPCLSLQPSLQPSFARLTNLVSLDIAGTDVPQLSILAVLTGLRSLSFSGERLLSVSGLSMLQQLGRLTCLDASKMCLETVPLIKLSLLSQLSRLQCLRLSQLDAEPSMAFKSLPMLPTQGPHAEPAARRLVEPMAQLPPTPGEPPGGAAAIYVMTQVAREWGALPCLQELDLSRSALVGDAMLDALSFSPLASKLTSLDLSGCNCMASRALEAAARISSLQALKLDDCWSCWSDAVSQLTQLQSCSMADARGVPLEALLSLLCHSTSLRALNMRGVSLQGDADGEEVDLGRLDWELCSPRCLQSLDVSSDFAPKLTLPDICSLFSPARLPLCAPAECGRATLAHWPLSCLTLLACTPSGPLPGVPAAFTSLQVLRLQGYTTWPLKLYQLNELLAGLSSLRELTVAPGTVYGGFGRCPHMLHPDPADGSGGVHVSHLSQLRSLSVCPLPLHLGSFACSGSVLRSSCSQLQCLDLTRQPDITDKDLREVAALTGLTKLSLGACFSITDVGISELSNLVKLQSLSLDHCHQVGVPALVGVLRALRFLEFLDITGLTLGPAVVDALIGCPRLQTLVASNCTGLDRATCDRLALCSRLRYLTLGGTLPRTELHDISTAFPHWTRVSGW